MKYSKPGIVTVQVVARMQIPISQLTDGTVTAG